MARIRRTSFFTNLEYEIDYLTDMVYTEEPIRNFTTLELFLMGHVHNIDDTECLRNVTGKRCSKFRKLRRDVLSDWMTK